MVGDDEPPPGVGRQGGHQLGLVAEDLAGVAEQLVEVPPRLFGDEGETVLAGVVQAADQVGRGGLGGDLRE